MVKHNRVFATGEGASASVVLFFAISAEVPVVKSDDGGIHVSKSAGNGDK